MTYSENKRQIDVFNDKCKPIYIDLSNVRNTYSFSKSISISLINIDSRISDLCDGCISLDSLFDYFYSATIFKELNIMLLIAINKFTDLKYVEYIENIVEDWNQNDNSQLIEILKINFTKPNTTLLALKHESHNL
jgi:hypothetical protein